MISSRYLATLGLAASTVLLASCETVPLMPVAEHDYGIVVDSPRLYDDQTLRVQLNALQAQLSRLVAIDPSITTRLGNVQGATSQQTSIGAQLSIGSSPGVSSVATSTLPSVTSQLVGVANAGSAGAPAFPASATQTTTTPGNSLQTTTTSPAMNPTAATLPAVTAPAMSTAFGLSAEDVLTQAMDLGNQIANLQLLLQGAVSDEYTSDGFGKRHLTLGFPVTITTPPDRRYKGLLAEVEVRICGFAMTKGTPESPALLTILPREKTYNVNSVTSDTKSLGAGAVISGIVNLGVGFLGVHQTSYLVQAQDTIALERRPKAAETCETGIIASPDDVDVPAMPGKAVAPGGGKGLKPLVFSWQFRPVLGRSTVQQGMRQMFAQISLPDALRDLPIRVQIRKFWRRYDDSMGIAHDSVAGDVDSPKEAMGYQDVQVNFNTLGVSAISAQPNLDGTITTRVNGHFLAGTSVRIGGALLGDGTPGFYNNGHFIAFTVQAQTLALALASASPNDETLLDAVALRSPMGDEVPIMARQPDVAQLNAISTGFDGNVSLTVRSPQPVTAVVSRPDSKTVQLGSYSPATRTLRLKNVFAGDLASIKFFDQKGVEHPDLGSQVNITPPALSSVRTRVEVFGLFDRTALPALSYQQQEVVGKANPSSVTYVVEGSPSPADLRLKQGGKSCPVALTVTDQSVQPHGANQYLVSLSLAQCPQVGPANGMKPIRYVVFAGKVYGFADAPFTSDQDRQLSWLVPASAVQSHQKIRLRQLFLDTGYSADIELDPPSLTQVDGVKLKFSGKVVRSVNAKKKAMLKDGIILGVTGSGLENAEFYSQSDMVKIEVMEHRDASYVELFIEDPKGIKQITVKSPGLAPQMIEMPSLSGDAPPKPDSKPQLGKAASVTQNATGSYVIKGSNLSDVVAVRYLKDDLPITISAGGDSITIDALPAGLTSQVGIRPLRVVFGDKTTKTFGVPVAAPKKAP